MTEQDNTPGQRSRREGLTEEGLDARRFGDGLGDTVDGKDVADLGRREDEPPGVGSGREPLGAQPHGRGPEDAGDIEDLGPEEGGPDDIEDQTGTDSGSSGLQNFA